MQSKKHFLFVALMIHALCGTGWAAWIGDKAPDFSLPAINNKTVSLKDYSGKIVFINFWAAWCGPCKIELPELNKLYQENKETVEVLAINLDKNKENAMKFLEKFPVTLPVLLDTGGKVVSQYGAKAMPTSFIIDQKGIIKFVHFGFSEKDPATWRNEINSLKGK